MDYVDSETARDQMIERWRSQSAAAIERYYQYTRGTQQTEYIGTHPIDSGHDRRTLSVVWTAGGVELEIGASDETDASDGWYEINRIGMSADEAIQLARRLVLHIAGDIQHRVVHDDVQTEEYAT